MLRQRATTDIATKGGQFDIITIGSYEAPIWGKQSWLVPLDDLGDDYDYADIIPSVKNGLSYDGKLYAVPFYAESSFTFYRKDLFEQAGIKMPDKPTYDQIAEYAAKLTDKSKEQYGFCQRGKPGWGENMAFVGPMVNAFGGRWFDDEVGAAAHQRAVEERGHLLRQEHERVRPARRHRQRPQREPGAVRDRPLRDVGRCHLGRRLHLQSRRRARSPTRPAFAPAPIAGDQQRLGLVLGLVARHPGLVEEGRCRQVVREMGDLQGLHHDWSASEVGWVSAPPGTRKSTYDNPEYQKAAPFAKVVYESVANADITKPTKDPVPYIGIQYVAIPEFQGHRHAGRPADRRGAGRSGDRRPGARDGAALDRADDEAGRLPEVS